MSLDYEETLWLNEVKNCKKIIHNRTTSKRPLQVKENFPLKEPIKYEVTSEPKTPNPIQLDTRTQKKLQGGRYPIDKKIDFHGLTIDQAFDTAVYNINYAYDHNLRCLLFITGKGSRTPQNRESIKEIMPKWLTQDFIANKILAYKEAKPKDGGSGAFYILIRRKK